MIRSEIRQAARGLCCSLFGLADDDERPVRAMIPTLRDIAWALVRPYVLACERRVYETLVWAAMWLL